VVAARERSESVARVLDRHARRHVGRRAGIVVGTLAGDERQVLACGPVAEDAIFEIGSITKVFTALLLARMAQDGRAALDERPFRGRPTTLADLATHTSGLARLPKGMLVRAVRERRDPYASFGTDDLDAALAAARVRPPGRVRYSNFGAGVLGHLLARRAGCSYAALVHREICAPLGLHDTSVDVAEANIPRFAVGHSRRGRPVPHWHLGALEGAGALRSTAADMLAFLACQLDPPESPLGAAVRLTHAERARRGRLGVGLGWLRLALRRGGDDIVWHNGGTGGFRSFAGFVPGRGAAVVVLANSARSVDAIGMRVLGP
jgi:serine-type D-Ala-D-Ala carboxypeptidase/endopeptidase